jgi:hypothetical protein
MMRGSVWQRLLCLTIIGSMALVIHLAESDLYGFLLLHSPFSHQIQFLLEI